MQSGPMYEGNLQEAVSDLLRNASDLTRNRPELEVLHRAVQHLRQRLEQPMRVAIVGRIKVGKSTFVNALLGSALAPTGEVEATFNVNWLKYGETPSVIVHFKDERPPEPKSIAELEAVTRRAEENQAYLLSIRHVEVFYPSDILQTFHLIDTPGLASFFEADSQNTRNFLQLHGEKLTQITQDETAAADAVLYLFAKGVSATDEALVTEFHGPVVGQATPINAIGLLNKVELYWPSAPDPMAAGKRIAGRLATHPRIRSLFYGVYPICGLLAFGARTLTDNDFDSLLRLAQVPERDFNRLMRNATRFINSEVSVINVSTTERQQLWERMGGFGISRAYHTLREGADTKEELSQVLLDYSGLPFVEKMIQSHFGNRAYLVKLGSGMQRIRALCFKEQQRLPGESREIIAQVAGRFEALAQREQAFQELDVLRTYYEGRVDLSDEEAHHLLQVTGEYGPSPLARLGLDETAPVGSLLPLAEERLRYWQSQATDVLTQQQRVIAARVLARSYERITRRVRSAVRQLTNEQAL